MIILAASLFQVYLSQNNSAVSRKGNVTLTPTEEKCHCQEKSGRSNFKREAQSADEEQLDNPSQGVKIYHISC